MNKSAYHNKIILSFFILLISLPAFFGMVLPKSSNSMIEKRRLADLPGRPETWGEFKKAPKRLEKYYQDHFGFRFSFLWLYRHLKYLIADSPLNTALFGNEKGWIFYDNKADGDVLGNYRNINQFTEQQLTNFIKGLSDKQKWLAKKGVEYLFVIVPSKHYIYPEYLPKYLYRTDQENKIKQLEKALVKHPEINYLNLTAALISAKNEQLLYFKADTHWNFHATNIAQFEIAKTLEKLFPNKLIPQFHQGNIFKSEPYQGDLALYMGLGDYFTEQSDVPELADCVDNYTPLNKSKRQKFSTTCVENGLKVMMFRDSFTTSLQPYLSLYFGQSHFVWKTPELATFKKHITHGLPDIVIEQRIDRYVK